MAKRFTDTEKWKKPFFRSLQAPYKLVWIYLLDECNHAGVWEVEFDVMKIRTGINTNKEEILNVFIDKIIPFDSGLKWFISDFIEFQYGKLDAKNRVHNSIIKILDNYKNKGLVSPLEGAKDKDKDKDKDKEEEIKEIDLTNIYKNLSDENKLLLEKYNKLIFLVSEEIFTYWKYNEVLQISKKDIIKMFLRCLVLTKKINSFVNLFYYYKKLYSGNDITFRCSLNKFMGNVENKYDNGIWNSENWESKLKEKNKDALQSVYVELQNLLKISGLNEK